ncbi:MAG: AsmA family protein [Candidatus Omnitrophica bacterium]|nr:AsmA family protein [Candidatus Omnitrophota bacterium]
MKIFKIVIIGVVVLFFISVAGVWIFLSTLDVNRYIPDVAKVVFQSTGRDLKVGHAGLTLSLTKGVALELKDVSLSDDKRFSDKLFLRIGRLVLAMDVKAALIDKSIVVPEVIVVDPEVMIIRAKDGSINVSSMQPQAVSSAVNTVGGGAVGSSSAAVSPVATLPVLLVKKIEVTNAVVHYIDRTFEPNVSADASKIMFNVNNFSLTAPFDFSLGAVVFSSEPDVNVTGRAALDMTNFGARLDAVKVLVTADHIQAIELNNALPMIKAAGFKQASGTINLEITKALVSAKGLEALDAQATVGLKDLILDGGNILSAGLNSIPLPGMTETVLADLPVETQADMKSGITAVDRLDVSVKADKDVITLTSAELSTRDLAVSTSGRIMLAGAPEMGLDLSGKLLIAPKVTDALVNKVPELSGLKSDDGRIDLPFAVAGTVIKPKVVPDAKYLTKKLLISSGKKELQKALGDPAVGKAVDQLFNTFFKGK